MLQGHSAPQDQQELEHRLKEVACDLRQRVRQELAFPAVVHFYTWLLQGACCCSQPQPHMRKPRHFRNYARGT